MQINGRRRKTTLSHPSINVYDSEFYPALVLLNWTVELYWLDKCLLYTVNDHDIVLLVPDSCWATARNGNSIIATTPCFCSLFFVDNLTVIWTFWYCRINTICALSENIKFICTRWARGQNNSPKIRFFYLFLKLEQIYFIFSDNVHTLTISHTSLCATERGN